MIDRITRLLEAALMLDTSADTIINTFFNTWIARFGAPACITTDRGAQFESMIFEAMTKTIGSQRIRHTIAQQKPPRGKTTKSIFIGQSG